MTLMRLIDAYSRGYITEAQYLAYLDSGYSNNSQIDVSVIAYTDNAYLATMRLIKRDPNLLTILEFEIQGSGALGVLQTNDTAYIRCPVAGRIMSYTAFVDVSTTTAFDIGVKATYPPGRGETIVASAPPTITSGYYIAGGETEVSTWDRVVAAGEYIAVIVSSSALATRATFNLVIEPATQLNALV